MAIRMCPPPGLWEKWLRQRQLSSVWVVRVCGTALEVLFALAFALALVWGQPARASDPLLLSEASGRPLGARVSYMKEPDSRWDLTQALKAYEAGQFAPGETSILTFGIGSRPVWIALNVHNESDHPQSRVFTVETSWLDSLDVYFLKSARTQNEYHLGDTLPFSQRPVKSRFYQIDHAFNPGTTQTLMRIETDDPIVVPIYLRTVEETQAADTWQFYSYGCLYGFLLGLMGFNLMLYATLRIRSYLFYSAYLASYVLLNIVYTGHGFAWIWPEQTWFQYMFPPFSMVMYAVGGLMFAAQFLNTRRNFPGWHRTMSVVSVLVFASLILLPVLGQKSAQMAVAFTFVFLFCAIMPVLGVLAYRSGYKPAKYFLLGASVAMTGAFFTDLSVAGVVPFNELTYRCSEIGMMLDAVLFSLALAYQYRIIQEDKVRAESLARIDPLTGLCNRRAFHEQSNSGWATSSRHDRPASVILLDVDHFKSINDTYGHDQGDRVLVAIANVLGTSAGANDVVARWGGEEFIVFLPDTDLNEASRMAERLRGTISRSRVAHQGTDIRFTASFGVAHRSGNRITLDQVISRADELLYQAKCEGRNRVVTD